MQSINLSMMGKGIIFDKYQSKRRLSMSNVSGNIGQSANENPVRLPANRLRRSGRFRQSSRPSLKFQQQRQRVAKTVDFDYLAKEKASLMETKRLQIAETAQQRPLLNTNISSFSPRSRTRTQSAGKGRLIVSNMSVPLIWNDSDHFKNKGDSRAFAMFAVVEVGADIKESQLVANVDRTFTDVTFPDVFTFENAAADFEMDISLYASRMDSTEANRAKLRKGSISRSLGYKFTSSVKSFASPLKENGIVNGKNFRLIGQCPLRLVDATDCVKVYDLKMSTQSDENVPPLYGHLCVSMAAEAVSCTEPLMEGVLTVRALNECQLLQNVFCRLQAARLSCYMDIADRCRLLATFFIQPDCNVQQPRQSELLVLTARDEQNRRKNLLIRAGSQEILAAWRRAFQRQALDSAVWGRRPLIQRQMSFGRQQRGVVDARRLYDQISIHNDGKGLSQQMTLPAKCLTSSRYSNRKSIQDLFPSVNYPGLLPVAHLPQTPSQASNTNDNCLVKKQSSKTSFCWTKSLRNLFTGKKSVR